MLVSDSVSSIGSLMLWKSLNPCFSGCWSRTRCVGGQEGLQVDVLILVLVDVGLGLVSVITLATIIVVS